MSQQYADAATWASWGFEVFPLKGKAPLTRHGHKDATADQSQIESWWERWPSANIGARPAANVVVLDIDPRHGGDTTWRNLNRGKSLPKTFITRTGSGGLHVWFQLPHKSAVNKTAGEGIDIKTRRGYLVMPGSIHPKTGREYVVQEFQLPENLPVLPAHLHRAVFRPPARPARIPTPLIDKEGRAAELIQNVANAAPGTRNDALNRSAFIAFRRGLNIDEELASAAACAGLPEPEIMRTINSARRAAGEVAA